MPTPMIRLVLIIGLTSLSACQSAPERASASATVDAFPHAVYERATARGIPVYDLAPGDSALRAFVYRSGAMAKQGHNHVIVARDWQGTLALEPDELDASRLDLRIPVEDLAVDPSTLREDLGAAFGSELSDKAVAGTRSNLLSVDLLQANDYPFIGVSLVGVTGELPRPILKLAITVRGGTTEVTVPVAVQRRDDRIRAEGRLIVSHDELGLTPFSAAGGALRVADPIVVEFALVGRRRSAD